MAVLRIDCDPLLWVPSDGFALVQAPALPEDRRFFAGLWPGEEIGEQVPKLVRRNPASNEGRRYSPFRECPGLFRDLTTMPTDVGAVLSLANRYGTLWETRDTGEMVDHWFAIGRRLRVIAAMWDCVLNKDRRALGRYLEPRETDPIGFGPWRAGPALREMKGAIALGTGELPRDIIQAARVVVAANIDASLHSRLSTRIGFDGNSTPHIAITARCLFDAVWLQLEMSLVDSRRYWQCKTCGRHQEASPSVSRSHKTYCSDA
jgi:hypothetical protein